ncbi:MAG TPA: hypothetical protein EYP34_11700 [Chromatiaceae bacterium]|nr:hypothetical protein [Chromatiaceae bacterium]
MSFFRLTIADDEVQKRTESYKNLMSMLYGFIIAFSVTAMSGFWYSLFPRSVNWNASQTVLVLHLAGGIMALFLFVVYFFLHQKDQQQRWWWLFVPWRLKQDKEEPLQHFRQRQLGHLLTWIMLVVFTSGLLIALPGLLFYSGYVWMQGYYTTQILRGVHFWASVLLVPVLITHMLWIARDRRVAT